LLATRDVTSIHNGFLTGTNYRKLTQDQKRIYAAGIIDGMFLAPVFDAPKRIYFKPKEMVPTTRVEWLEACVEGMSDEQVAAIISKWLTDHPARWHESANTSVYSAFFDSCPAQPKGI
jgi:hypothetical protein